MKPYSARNRRVLVTVGIAPVVLEKARLLQASIEFSQPRPGWAMATVLQAAVDTENLPRYNMRRAASRPPPSARPRVLAKSQPESTLVQTTPSGPSPQTNEVVIALAQAAAAIAKEVAATGPEPLVAAVDLKHADLQPLGVDHVREERQYAMLTGPTPLEAAAFRPGAEQTVF